MITATTLRPFLAAACILAGASLPAPAEAQNRQPLIQEGTSTIFERVLTRPGATFSLSPGGGREGDFAAFQPLYVFAREGEFVEVGPSARGTPQGWVRADAVVEWKQNIVAAFTNPAGRERQLLFESKEALDTLLNLQAPVSTAQAYREAAVAAAAQAAEDGSVSTEPSEGGVVSVEPEVHIDVEQEFYILPILDWLDELHPQSVEPYLQLKVASLPLQEAEENETGGIVNYQAGIVFLIDTTQSMQPYIDEAAEAMAALVQQIRANELGSRINFGIYGFRDNPAAADGIEYRVKEYLPLERREDQQPVVDTLRAMEVARVNTPGFNEDSIAAVDKALRDIPWTDRGFGGKYIILLTDAGPKAPGDANALLDDNAEGINSFATTSAGASISTIHLQTQEGRANHAYAEREYRKLSRFGQDVLYYPIEEGDAASYSAQVNRIAEFVTSAVEDAMNGELANPEEAETEEEAALARVTLAMQLAFLGETEGGGAPDVFEAWTADASIEDASIVALEPRLLITKNELSTLSDVVQAAISAGEDTRSGGNAGDFFDQLQGAMARMSQNPDVLTNSEFETLGEAFGEFMERLPYRSRLLTIDRDTWVNGGALQREVIDGLQAKLALYRRYDAAENLWIEVNPGAPDGERVFAMPLYDLP